MRDKPPPSNLERFERTICDAFIEERPPKASRPDGLVNAVSQFPRFMIFRHGLNLDGTQWCRSSHSGDYCHMPVTPFQQTVSPHESGKQISAAHA